MPSPPVISRISRCALIPILALAVSTMRTGDAAANERPSVQFTRAPAETSSAYYAQQFGWAGADADGSVASYRWAIDPSPVDTFWIDTPDTSRFLFFTAGTPETPYAAAGFPQFCSNTHTVVVKSVDDLGLDSPVAARSFVARNQAPSALITTPTPSLSVIAHVPTTIFIDWTGSDPDGSFSILPVFYKYRLASRPMIQAALGITTIPTAAQLQQYFALEAPGFASWDIASSDSSHITYTNLLLVQFYYFAVLAFDEATGWDPRFTRSTNVLAMQVTSIADVSGAGAFELGFAPPSPNPARRTISFDITLARGGDARLEIFDTAGRRVRALVAGRREGGHHAVAWDLLDDSGGPTPPGIYLARFSAGDRTRIRRFVVLQ